MKKYFAGLLIAATVFTTSCSEDIDLTANYKDITIAYGLLDASKDTQYVRIHKAFIGDGDAILYSAIADSIYYPNTLIAYLLAYNSSNVKVDSIYLERVVDAVNKDSGLFAHEGNVLYRGVDNFDSSRTYKLVIIKPNGDTTTSTTTMARKKSMAFPPNNMTNLTWENISITGPEKIVDIEWIKDPNNYACQLQMDFNYQEWTVGDPGNIVAKKISYVFPLFLADDAEHIKLTNRNYWSISKSTFYGIIVNNVDEDPVGTNPNDVRVRRFISLDFVVYQATKQLYDYIDINKPSLSFVQKITSYTNIKNGLGIFASRTTSGITSINLNTQTKDSLRLGQYTSDLNFVP